MDLFNLEDTPKQNNSLSRLPERMKYERFDDGYLIPALGKNEWDGHIFVSGATNAGKSYLIKKMVMNDVRKRDIVIFSDLKEDKSFEELYETGRTMLPDQVDQTKEDPFAQKILIFDDDTNKDHLKIRDHFLEKGRHPDSVVICVNHKLQDWHATKKALNEAKYVVMFPAANKIATYNFLKRMGFKRDELNSIMDVAVEDGRYLIFHQHNPNALISQRTIMYI